MVLVRLIETAVQAVVAWWDGVEAATASLTDDYRDLRGDVSRWFYSRPVEVTSWATHYLILCGGTFLAHAVGGVLVLLGVETGWAIALSLSLALVGFYLLREVFKPRGADRDTVDQVGDWLSALWGFATAMAFLGPIIYGPW